jgi:hypothetical protein
MSRMVMRAALLAGANLLAICAASGAWAHGFAGPRFFPATLATDDPFVAEELSLPTYSWTRESDQTETSEFAFDFAKRITRNFGMEFGATYLRVRPPGGPTVDGWDNLALGLKYQLAVDPVAETIFSIGVDLDIGGTGSQRLGAEGFTSFTSAVFFGKGFGDLSDRMSWARAFAVTGSAGVSVPAEIRTDDGFGGFEYHPDMLELGFALEYSVPYLQSQVRNIGLIAPFDRMIPIVEFALEKPIDHGGGAWTGTVNPGLIWAGQYVQLAAEAVIPMNGESGRGTGFRAQLHFFIDDLFPDSLGRPIFGE